MTQGPQATQQVTGWRVSLSRDSTGLKLFQVASLVSELSFRLTYLRVTLSFFTYWGCVGGGQFPGLPEPSLSCLSSCFRRFPSGWNVSISQETVEQFPSPQASSRPWSPIFLCFAFTVQSLCWDSLSQSFREGAHQTRLPFYPYTTVSLPAFLTPWRMLGLQPKAHLAHP